MKNILLITAVLLMALPFFGQATEPELKSVQAFTARQFPSLVPVPIIKVPLADIIGTDPQNWPIRANAASSYKVTNTKTKKTLVIARVDQPGEQDLTIAYLIMQTAFPKAILSKCRSSRETAPCWERLHQTYRSKTLISFRSM